MPTDNRPAVYTEGDNVIYRASALGHCLRSLWAARNDMDRKDIPRTIKRGMDEGTALEPTILNILKQRHGFSLLGKSQAVIELNVGAWNGKTLIVRGAADEVGNEITGLNPLPIDVKAFTQDDIDLFLSKKWEAFPRYAWQQSVYALGWGHDGFFMPIFNKATWEIERWSLAPHKPIFTREQIRDRVMQVEEAFYSGIMPEECDADYACQYPYLHDKEKSEPVPDSAIIMCRARIKLSEKIKTLTEARQTLDKVITGKLSESTYYLDGYNIVLFASPRRFNTAQAKALLTESGIDWEHDPEMWIASKGGTLVRMTPKK